MKQELLEEIIEAVTGVNKEDYYWDSKKESIRNIHRSLKCIIRDEEVNSSNKYRYIDIYKLIYNDDSIKSLINKKANIIKNTKIEGTTLILPTKFKKTKVKGIKDIKIEAPAKKYELTLKENIKISEILLEFFRGEEKGDRIEEFLIRAKSDEYNLLLAEFEEEVERIKISIHGYIYKAKVEKIKEIKDYLKKQREEIEKNIMDSLILPEQY